MTTEPQGLFGAEEIIHLEWEGPWTLQQIAELKDPNQDVGVYQIYGKHTLYGSHCLLYIGKAVEQAFGTRIAQERWGGNRDPQNVQIYVGRLGLTRALSHAEFERLVDRVESLLIYAHGPACNASKLASLASGVPQGLRLMNWGASRDLMPEVSSDRWNDRHWSLPGYQRYQRRNDMAPSM